MSTINVDNVFPQSGNIVDVNGVKIRLNADSLQMNGTAAASTAAQSTIVGKGAGVSATSTANTFFGYNAGRIVSTGGANTFIGAASGGNCSTGLGNTCIGNGSGGTITTGNTNTFVGDNVGNTHPTFVGQNNICIGSGSTPSVNNANGEITLGNAFINVLRCNVTSITSLSDARDKKDVKELGAGLEFVKGLKPVEFVWDDRDNEEKRDIKDCGFIAQDLKKSQEDAELADTLKLVYESNPDKLEATYGRLIPVLVKAIQDLSAKVEALEAK